MLEIDKQTILDLAVSIDNLTSAITCLEKDSRPQNTNQRLVASLRSEATRMHAEIQRIDRCVAHIDEMGLAGRTVTWSDIDKIRRILRS